MVVFEPSAIAGFIVQEPENKNLHENEESVFSFTSNPLIPSDKDEPTLEPSSSPAGSIWTRRSRFSRSRR